MSPWRRFRDWKHFNFATAVIVLGLAALFPLTQDPLSGFMDDCILALAYVVMALGLNIVVGFAGLLDLGYVAFYAFGAYSMGWFASDFFSQVNHEKGIHIGVTGFAATLPGIHLNFFLILLVAVGFAAIAGIVIGLPTLRLRGDYIAIVTLAFGEIIGRFAVNGEDISIHGYHLTNGRQAISPVDQINFFGYQFNSAFNLRPYYWFILGLVAFVLFVNFRLRDFRSVVSVVVPVLVWDRDLITAKHMVMNPMGWCIAALITLTWPLAVFAKHPEALRLWGEHVVGRFAHRGGGFASEPWWEYGVTPLSMLLPWTPLAFAGAWRSWQRARKDPKGLDRLLFAWALAPVFLISLARARNSHYLLPALCPWSIWSAQSLVRFGERLTTWGWTSTRQFKLVIWGFGGISLSMGLCFALLGPKLEWRGFEWAFYERAGQLVPLDEPIVFLYDDWDRRPYPTPFGPMPYDLAARLFYLRRPGTWCESPDALASKLTKLPQSFAIIGRERDL